MKAFDKLVEHGLSVAGDVMGERFIYEGKEIDGILDELEMSVDRELYGDNEEATAEIVFKMSDLTKKPESRMVIRKVDDGARFRVLSLESSTRHYTLRVKRLGKQSRGE